MLFIDVPYGEKDEAKSVGARWDSARKKWYVPDKRDYSKFQKWILGDDEEQCTVLCDHFYIAEGEQKCFKCREQIKVIGFGIENYYEYYREGVFQDDPAPEYQSGEIHISSSITSLDAELLEFLKQRYNYYYGYSKFADSYDYGNHCRNCGVLQGNFFLFSEVGSPFFIDSPEVAARLTLYKVPLIEDIKIKWDEGYGSGDCLIKEYAQIIPFQDSMQDR
jgi:hypothetical protein